MKSRFAILSLSLPITALVGMLAASQACTLTVTDTPLDGGLFPDTGALPDTGVISNPCNECLFQTCTGNWASCQGSTDCMTIYACASAPSCRTDAQCVDDCYSAGTPDGQRAYYYLAACNAARRCDSCLTVCNTAQAICVDASAPDASPPDDCNSCSTRSCPNEKGACSTGSPCDQYSQCLAVCTDPATLNQCIQACDTNFAAGKAAQDQLNTCLTNNCKNVCGL